MKLIIMVCLLYSVSTLATFGTQPMGVGTKEKSLGGASAATSDSALIASYNPAGVVLLPREFDMGVSIFHPTRSYYSQDQALYPNNEEQVSRNPYYLIPAMGYSRPLDDKTSFGFAMFPKGGGGVLYKETATFANFGVLGGTTDGTGVWTSASLEQLGMSYVLSRKVDDSFRVGGGPLVGLQRFSATGLGYFKAVSADPENVTDNGYDTSWGYGWCLGFQKDLSTELSLGGAYHSQLNMSPFKKYAGLMAQNGKLDLAGQWMLGVQYKFSSKFRVVADYHVIEFSKVRALSNSHTQKLATGTGTEISKTVGGEEGAGFGWEDVTIWKLGAEWLIRPDSWLRMGYSEGNSPIGSEDVLFNILAPAVTEKHASIGMTKKINESYQMDVTYVKTFKNQVSGNNLNNAILNDVTISMEQEDLEFGLSIAL